MFIILHIRCIKFIILFVHFAHIFKTQDGRKLSVLCSFCRNNLNIVFFKISCKVIEDLIISNISAIEF